MNPNEALQELKNEIMVLENMSRYNKDFESKNDCENLTNKKEVLEVAIKALEKQITNENYCQKWGDLISRTKLLDDFRNTITEKSGTIDWLNMINCQPKEELLLKLPCKVDDIIWDNSFGSPCSYKVTGFSYGDLSNDDYDYKEMPKDELIVHYRDRSGCITGSFPVSEIGETVFFTRKEAAEKRKEMEDAE